MSETSHQSKVSSLSIKGPHQSIAVSSRREAFTAALFDQLWQRYRDRVEHIAVYERMIAQAGATFVNDHVAFRTFASERPLTGIASISRIFDALGYRASACYEFPDKHLNAVHYQHPNGNFPKVFISELKIWELSSTSRDAVSRTLDNHRDPISVDVLADLASLDEKSFSDSADLEKLQRRVVRDFHELPWNPPERNDVTLLNEESQYAAWVSVHGYNVNHFTSLVNSHGVDSLDDIEKSVEALRKAGVPMKDRIEGEPGSKLQQSATEAAVIDVPVLDGGVETRTPWTYAYFELAERGMVANPETGRPIRFEGFLGPQATHLFEMTALAESAS